ncbi:MAG: hypothetical protein KAR42_03490 [candidate division Zixibacteria bacterium]|nr:hypothetical protein [candidate division Zixibacteria bacterium]
MYKTSKTIVLVLGMMVLFGISTICHASQPRIPQPIDATFELVGPLQKNVPITFKVIYGPKPGHDRGNKTGKITAFVYQFRARDDTVSFTSWETEFDENLTATRKIELSIPDNDTIAVEIVAWCGVFSARVLRTFITTDDKVEYHEKFYIPFIDRYPANSIVARSPDLLKKPSHPDRDTLTVEQLDIKYNVLIDLKNDKLRESAKNILGVISESNKTDICSTCYIMDISLGDIYQLLDVGIKPEATSPAPWEQKKETPNDSLPEIEDTQGVLDEKLSPKSLDGFSLDHVEGLAAPGVLALGVPITFYLRMNNPSSTRYYAIANGFRVYSDDDADWNSFSPDTLSHGWDDMFDFFYEIRSFSADGIGSDTSGYSGFNWYNDGLPPYFDEVAYTITIGPFDMSSAGKTICLDSCKYGSSGTWGWSDSLGVNMFEPNWDGPHCFTISNNIIYSGQLLYYEKTASGNYQVPMRNIRVEMFDEDTYWDDSLGVTSTDDSGYFSFDPVENDDGWFDDSLDIYFKIKAVNETAYYTEEYNGDTLLIQTEVQNNMASGIHDTTFIADTSSSGMFFVINAVKDAHDYWDTTASINLNAIQVVYDDHNDTLRSYYQPGLEFIHIENYDSAQLAFPDTYDDDIIYHEYGHYIEDMCNFFDGGGGSHGWLDIINPELAASEGFAHFFSGILRNSEYQINFEPGFYNFHSFNLENGEYRFNNIRQFSGNNYGHENECAVAGILWDIYDYESTLDDYSTYQWPPNIWPHQNPQNPDAVGDSLCDGYTNIMDVLLNRNVDGAPPDNISEFWQAWFQTPSNNHFKAMRDIWYEHGIMKCGDTNCDGEVNAGDATYIINWAFKGGPAPIPIEAGDVNCDAGTNMADAVYLINYTMKNGPVPCASCL